MAALLISTTMFLGLGVTLATAPLNSRKKYDYDKDTVSIEQATSALRYSKKMATGSEQRWKQSISRSLKNMFRIKSNISDLKEQNHVKAEEIERELNSQVLNMLRRSKTEMKYSKATGNSGKDEIFNTALKNVVTELMSDNTDDSNFEKSVMKLQTAADNSLGDSQIDKKNLNTVKAMRAAVNEIEPIPIVSEAETQTETIAQPATAQPATAQPATAQPATAQPATAQPATAQPATAQPATAQPATAQPATTTEDLTALRQQIEKIRKHLESQTQQDSRQQPTKIGAANAEARVREAEKRAATAKENEMKAEKRAANAKANEMKAVKRAAIAEARAVQVEEAARKKAEAEAKAARKKAEAEAKAEAEEPAWLSEGWERVQQMRAQKAAQKAEAEARAEEEARARAEEEARMTAAAMGRPKDPTAARAERARAAMAERARAERARAERAAKSAAARPAAE